MPKRGRPAGHRADSAESAIEPLVAETPPTVLACVNNPQEDTAWD